MCGLLECTQNALVHRARLLIRRGLRDGLLVGRLRWLLIRWLRWLLVHGLSRLLISGLRRLLVRRLSWLLVCWLLISCLRGLLVRRLRWLLIDLLCRLLLISLIVWLNSRLLVGWLWLRIGRLLTVNGLLSVCRLLTIDWLLLWLLSDTSAERSSTKRECTRPCRSTTAANEGSDLADGARILNTKIEELGFLPCRQIVREHFGSRNLASNSGVKGARLHVRLSLTEQTAQKVVSRNWRCRKCKAAGHQCEFSHGSLQRRCRPHRRGGAEAEKCQRESTKD